MSAQSLASVFLNRKTRYDLPDRLSDPPRARCVLGPDPRRHQHFDRRDLHRRADRCQLPHLPSRDARDAHVADRRPLTWRPPPPVEGAGALRRCRCRARALGRVRSAPTNFAIKCTFPIFGLLHFVQNPDLRPARFLTCPPNAPPLDGSVETWPSGRRRSPAKGVGPEGSRGFESLRLRHLTRYAHLISLPSWLLPFGAYVILCIA